MSLSAQKAYRNAEVETISQRDLLVRLYQGAERFLTIAQEAMRSRKIEEAHNNCQKAKAIFQELLSTLNFEVGGDTAIQLRDLYAFFISQIVQANLAKQPTMLAELMPIIAKLRTAWEQIPAEHANLSSVSSSQGHSLFVRT